MKHLWCLNLFSIRVIRGFLLLVIQNAPLTKRGGRIYSRKLTSLRFGEIMPIEKITIIGAGTMGHGIAQVAAQAGYTVTLEDVTEEFVSRGLSLIKDNLKKGVERGKV